MFLFNFFAAQFWLFNVQKWLEKTCQFLPIVLFDFDLYENFYMGGSILDKWFLWKILAVWSTVFWKIFLYFLLPNFDFLIYKNGLKKIRPFFGFYENFQVRITFGLAIFTENFGYLIDNFFHDIFVILYFLGPILTL